MKKYWLCVNQDTFIWKKRESLLFFDTVTGEKVKLECSTLWNEKYEDLMKPESLYTTVVDDLDLIDPSFAQGIEILQKRTIIKLIEQDGINLKPVSFLPILGLQRSREKFIKERRMLEFENSYAYLQGIILYLNGNIAYSNDIYEQQPYFLNGIEEFDFYLLDKFFKEIRLSATSEIKICGTNIFQYQNLNLLLDLLDQMHMKKELYVSCYQLKQYLDLAIIASHEQFCWKIVVDKSHCFMKDIAVFAKNKALNVEWLFYVADLNDCQYVESIIEKEELMNYQIKPIYTGGNSDFFEQYIYLLEDDINSIKLNKRQVFAHQAINTNDFGILNVFPNGDVYANVNMPLLGNLKNNSVQELIIKEILSGESWLRIRNGEPCSNCLYQWICQSPSNYELVIGKSNLCHIS